MIRCSSDSDSDSDDGNHSAVNLFVIGNTLLCDVYNIAICHKITCCVLYILCKAH